MQVQKPRVFIASSVEGLPVAEAVNANLDHDTVPTIWKGGTFHLSSNTVDDLVKKASQVDFAIFLFTPDDVATSRGKSAPVVRDNVLFELGLFIGTLGKERCFIVRPRGVNLYMPTDLLGLIAADYAVDRGDEDWFSATNTACTKIRNEIKRFGNLERLTPSAQINGSVVPAKSRDVWLGGFDLQVLGIVATTCISNPSGIGFHRLRKSFEDSPEGLIAISMAKLLKLTYVEKSVEWDPFGESHYFVFQLTEEGMHAFLANENFYNPPVPAQRVP